MNTRLWCEGVGLGSRAALEALCPSARPACAMSLASQLACFLATLIVAFVVFVKLAILLRSPQRTDLCGSFLECELVVAYCEEPLAWLLESDWFQDRFSRTTIYSKCGAAPPPPQQGVRVVTLPNVGSCDYVYLYHITRHWDALLPEIALVKGSERPPHEWHRLVPQALFTLDTAEVVRGLFSSARRPQTRVQVDHLRRFSLGAWAFSYNLNRRATPFHRSGWANHSQWLTWVCGTTLADWLYSSVEFVPFQGYYTTRRDNIHRYPKGLYVRMMRGMTHANEEVDHFVERTWGLLLTSQGAPPQMGLYAAPAASHQGASSGPRTSARTPRSVEASSRRGHRGQWTSSQNCTRGHSACTSRA